MLDFISVCFRTKNDLLNYPKVQKNIKNKRWLFLKTQRFGHSF